MPGSYCLQVGCLFDHMPSYQITHLFSLKIMLFLSFHKDHRMKGCNRVESDYVPFVLLFESAKRCTKSINVVFSDSSPNIGQEFVPKDLCCFAIQKDMIYIFIVGTAENTYVWIQTSIWELLFCMKSIVLIFFFEWLSKGRTYTFLGSMISRGFRRFGDFLGGLSSMSLRILPFW